MHSKPVEMSDDLPTQLYPCLGNHDEMSSAGTEFKHAERAAPAAAAAAVVGRSASASLPSGAPSLSSFRSSLSGASLASFHAELMLPLPASLPPPSRPLLSRSGRSSARLGLAAIDPDSSVLSKEVLHKMKLSYMKHGAPAARPSSAARASPAASEPPRKSTKRRSSRISAAAGKAAEADEHEIAHKKSKTLPLVPKSSLTRLHKQLSHTKGCSRADVELAAVALARHLVDWAAQFDLEPDSGDEAVYARVEAEFEEVAEDAASVAESAAEEEAASSAADLPDWLMSAPLSPQAARAQSGVALDGGPVFEYASAASTPAFEPDMHRADSQASQASQASLASLATLSPDEEAALMDAQARAQEQAQAREQEQLFMPDVEPDATTHEHATPQAFLLSPFPLPLEMGAHLASPVPSPKVSPALLAHLASPHERAAMLSDGFALDGGSGGLQSPPLAQTMTSSGARVALIQHQMAW